METLDIAFTDVALKLVQAYVGLGETIVLSIALPVLLVVLLILFFLALVGSSGLEIIVYDCPTCRNGWRFRRGQLFYTAETDDGNHYALCPHCEEMVLGQSKKVEDILVFFVSRAVIFGAPLAVLKGMWWTVTRPFVWSWALLKLAAWRLSRVFATRIRKRPEQRQSKPVRRRRKESDHAKQGAQA